MRSEELEGERKKRRREVNIREAKRSDKIETKVQKSFKRGALPHTSPSNHCPLLSFPSTVHANVPPIIFFADRATITGKKGLGREVG